MARNKGVHAKLSRRQKPTKKATSKQPSKQAAKTSEKKTATRHSKAPNTLKERFIDFYDQHYLKLMIIPILLLVLSVGQIAVQYSTTGDYFDKDVSLSGGITMTLLRSGLDVTSLETDLVNQYGDGTVSVRSLRRTGDTIGAIIEGSTEVSEEELVQKVRSSVGGLQEDEYSVEITGSSLGQAFFGQLFFALLLAFVFMAIVVFIYFRSWAPSMAVIVAAFADIIETVAVMNLLDVKLSAAGIAALLMLIGYSVDTDMLLSTRMIRRTEGSMYDRMISAMKPAMLMTCTTLTAVGIALIFSESAVLKQIMLIVFVGLLLDIFNTWLFNAGILTYWLKNKGGSAK